MCSSGMRNMYRKQSIVDCFSSCRQLPVRLALNAHLPTLLFFILLLHTHSSTLCFITQPFSSGEVLTTFHFAKFSQRISNCHQCRRCVCNRSAYMTPSIPIRIGKIIISGKRKITCLVKDTTIPSCAFPIEVKNPDDIG